MIIYDHKLKLQSNKIKEIKLNLIQAMNKDAFCSTHAGQKSGSTCTTSHHPQLALMVHFRWVPKKPGWKEWII
jgi:hypothetical protein